jgi:predicted  nucleic acid-binding Zn-ribbon protein
MSTEHPEETRPTFGRRLGKGLLWLLRFALRLFFVVLLGIALGIGIFYGAAALYNQYIMPVQVHTIQLEQVQTRQEQDSALTTRRLNDLQERVDTLTLQGDSNKQAFAGLEVSLAEVRASQEGQETSLAAVQALQAELAALQTELAALQADLEAVQADLEAAQAALETGDESFAADLEALQSAQERVGAALGRLQAEQESLGRELESQQAEMDAWPEHIDAVRQEIGALAAGLEGDLAPAALRRDLILAKAMNLLARARLLLVQSNYGLAQTDLRAARELLVALSGVGPEGQAVVDAIVARLDAALGNLPEAPVAAADELDGAWQLLAAGLPTEAAVAPALEITPAMTTTVSLTPTVTLTPTGSLTPTAASEITPTATITPTSTGGS